jgi:hypothetical protein
MGLRSKLVVGISMYLGLLAFVGLMGLYDAQVSLNGLHDALEHHVRELSLLANLSSAVGRVHSVVLVHVLTNAVTSGGSGTRSTSIASKASAAPGTTTCERGTSSCCR